MHSKGLLINYRFSANSFRGNYSFLNLALCNVTFDLYFIDLNSCHGNYSREETIQKAETIRGNTVCHLGKGSPKDNLLNTGLSSLGVPGVPWPTQILADQLTLFHPRGTDYAHLITSGTTGISDLPTALDHF